MMDYARADMLIDGATLQGRLGEANLRIVDCDPPDAYRRVHLPGAVPVKDNFFKDVNDRRFVMPPEQFGATMAEMGIGDETEVVTYDAGGTTAARLWWCLNYYGHTKVRVLNGGWNLWLKEGRPLTMDAAKVSAGPFTPRADESLRASAEYIMASIDKPGVVLLDVRSDGEWDGSNTRGNKRGGRMPGAVHCEWTNNLTPDDEKRWKSEAELKAQFEALGATPDKEIITYCQGGIRAAQALFTLKLLGYENVRNYDGSFSDWGNRDDTPIITGK